MSYGLAQCEFAGGRYAAAAPCRGEAIAADEPCAPEALVVSPAALYLPLAYAGAGGLGRSHHGLSMSTRIDNLPDDHRLRATFVKRAIRRVDGSGV